MVSPPVEIDHIITIATIYIDLYGHPSTASNHIWKSQTSRIERNRELIGFFSQCPIPGLIDDLRALVAGHQFMPKHKKFHHRDYSGCFPVIDPCVEIAPGSNPSQHHYGYEYYQCTAAERTIDNILHMLQGLPRMEESDVPKKGDCFDDRGREIRCKLDLCRQWEMQKEIDRNKRSLLSYLELYQWPDTIEKRSLRDLWNHHEWKGTVVRICSRGDEGRYRMMRRVEMILERRGREYRTSFEEKEIESQVRRGKIAVTTVRCPPEIIENNCLVIDVIHVQTMAYGRMFDTICYNDLVTTTSSTLKCYVSDDYLAEDFVKDAPPGYPPTLFVGYINMI